jgi:DNA-binding NtrC family response regulator
MEDPNNCILYVGTPGSHFTGSEHALVANGIGVASVTAPESAITYVRNSPVRVVLLDDTAECNLPLLASCLKVSQPYLRIIALVSQNQTVPNVDTVLEKPIAVEDLLDAVNQNLAQCEAEAVPV